MRIGLVLAAAVAVGSAAVSTPHVIGQGAPTVGIDMDITGNDDSTIGVIQDCAELSLVGDTLTFDLVIQGVDAATRIAGYQIDIDYDPSVIQINSVIDADAAGSTAPNDVTMISRVASGGGPGFITLSEFVEPGMRVDDDGSFTVAAVDGTLSPVPSDNHEDGEGVLARITIEAVGTGLSDLTIPGPLGGTDGASDLMIIAGAGPFAGNPIAIDALSNAAVSVDTPCKPPPSPAVPGTDTPLPDTPGAGTSEPGTSDAETPQPGTPGAETQTDGPPGTEGGGQTPGPGTPVLGGTPVFDAEGGEGGDAPGAGESDGLSAGAWAGIGAGVAAAVVAASGAGWFALRRRRAGGTPTSGGKAGPE
jgi:hypothetical protein